MTSQEIQQAFSKPFGLDDLKFLPKNVKGDSALAMPYISARAVQDRLDEVVGVDNWMDEYVILNDGSVMCSLKVKVGEQWVTKADVGSPSEQPDSGDRLKAAFSDALKRAAVKFGIGRFLYRLPPVWAKYDSQKRQFSERPRLPDWVLKGMSAPATTHPQQNQQPQPQRAVTPPAQQPQSPSVQPNNGGGDVLAGCLGAIDSSVTAVELQAAVFAAKAHIDAKRLTTDGAVKVGDAIQAKVVSLVSAAATKQGLDGVYAVYEKSIAPLMNEQRKAAILQAFNGKTFDAAEDEAFA